MPRIDSNKVEGNLHFQLLPDILKGINDGVIYLKTDNAMFYFEVFNPPVFDAPKGWELVREEVPKGQILSLDALTQVIHDNFGFSSDTYHALSQTKILIIPSFTKGYDIYVKEPVLKKGFVEVHS
jgi:hypothetical protein